MALQVVLHGVAIAAEHLETHVGDLLVGLACVELEDRRVPGGGETPVESRGVSVDQHLGDLDHGLHVGETVRHRLELRDGPPKLLPLLGVIHRIGKSRGGCPGPSGGETEALVAEIHAQVRPAIVDGPEHPCLWYVGTSV